MRVVKRVKARLLKFRKEQARKSFAQIDSNDPAIRELSESMRVRQLHAIWCDTEFFVITGHRRTLAGQLLDLEVDVCITDEPLTSADIGLIQWQENEDRVGLTDNERHLSLNGLRAHHAEASQKEFAAIVKRSESFVTKWLSPSRVILAAQKAFEAGQLGITDCYLMSTESEQVQQEMLQARLAGSTRDEIGRLRGRKRKSSATTVKVNRVTCALPSGVSVVVSGLAVSLDDFVSALAEAQKQAKAALKDGLDAKVFCQVMARKAKPISTT